MSIHLSGWRWLFPPVPPARTTTLVLRSNLWVPLGFCGRLRVVWKELQMAWPWHRDEARQRGEQITEVASWHGQDCNEQGGVAGPAHAGPRSAQN